MRRAFATAAAAALSTTALVAAPAVADTDVSTDSSVVLAQSSSADLDGFWPMIAPSAAPILLPIIALVLWLNPDTTY